jgi:hypothetical protein
VALGAEQDARAFIPGEIGGVAEERHTKNAITTEGESDKIAEINFRCFRSWKWMLRSLQVGW